MDSDPKERRARLLNWEQAPFARAVHPEEDHFISLHVAVGAAEEEPAAIIYHEDDFAGSITATSYEFGLNGKDRK
jgi:aromatic ring-opening dioxygenase catalytic subunit (LigB family)